MVNNSTNINHHSLYTKKKGGGETPSDVGNAGHGLGQDKLIGWEKICIAIGYTNDHSKTIDA
jgi:hypothetical protein